MSLAERGLLYSMRLECWVNHTLPNDTAKLAKVLGYSEAEIVANLPGVRSFFSFSVDKINSQELDDYRAHLEGINAKKSEGGKKGAAKTNSKTKQPATLVEKGIEDGSGISQVTRDISRGSLVKFSSVKSSTTQPLKEDSSEECEAYKEWMGSDYEKASNGE